MRKALPIILLLVGLTIVGYGLLKKNDEQGHLDLGIVELQVGNKDSVFTPYFLIGGIAALAGVALMATRRKI